VVVASRLVPRGLLRRLASGPLAGRVT
jgi:hypothetical protein